mmetsp:Transcript_100471/g.199504  ORF Transcript_100471/g.199504 Transcript_100471/m.199504 type:complete len:294 (+) Transcript_100471:69-950(+)|eukprot:CAMPEP_0172684864 /NCGR_PEP_ID=MMETSP1074-20121228/19859_1 /TAXON_ID=2916 /ORGANISM="Ceratium fusus, Strain PA161109" /LENGTH=293 /DNA_ID=CAMNT_0013503939 /DNA_START=45 /DNA_END=926 /DNA_ORIENTATION=-
MTGSPSRQRRLGIGTAIALLIACLFMQWIGIFGTACCPLAGKCCGSCRRSKQPMKHAQHAGPAGVLLVTGSEEPLWGRTQIAFDVMGTVVQDNFAQVAQDFFGMTKEELFSVKNQSAWTAFEYGDITESELHATYFKDGREFDLAGLKTSLMASYKFVDGMPDLLTDLAEVGHKLHCFTNYPEWYTMIEEKLGLEAEFGLQWTCVSCDTGLRKPEPFAFAHFVRRLGGTRKVGAAPILFIDDAVANCEAANLVGVNAIHFHDTPGLRKNFAGIIGSRKEGTVPSGGWPSRIMR